MKKPDDRRLRRLRRRVPARPAPRRARKQYLVPYFIACHPGSDLNAMIDLALFLKRNGYRPDQVQDFIPARSTSPPACTTRASTRSRARGLHRQATCATAKLQRALLQFFKPENYFEVREALLEGRAARPDRQRVRLPDPGQPPKAALQATDGEGEQVAGRRASTSTPSPACGRVGIGPSGRRRGGGRGRPAEGRAMMAQLLRTSFFPGKESAVAEPTPNGRIEPLAVNR